MKIIVVAILSIVLANALWQLLLTVIENHRRKMYMPTSVTLNEFLNRSGDHINQVVYKVDGDFNGDIKGDNVTVILMGDGDINGDINAKDGEVVLIKGNVNGDIKANRVLCPTASNVDNPSIKYTSGTCFNCTHMRFGLCDVINKSMYRLTPCENYERKYI